MKCICFVIKKWGNTWLGLGNDNVLAPIATDTVGKCPEHLVEHIQFC